MKRLKSLLLFVSVWCGLLVMARSASGQTWTQTSAPTTNWWSVACSADGTKLAAVNIIPPDPTLGPASPIYTSTNSGATWIPNGPGDYSGRNWEYIASSADGTKLIAAAYYGSLYTSTDSGINWTAVGPLNDYSSNITESFPWNGIASSADGGRIVAVAGSPYASTNFGATWALFDNAPQTCIAIASSADGIKLMTASDDDTVYISTNSGTTWLPTSLPNELWWSVASSADGRKLVAGVAEDYFGLYSNGVDYFFGGPIYTSADSGATWTLTSAPTNFWNSIASSADGTILVASANTSIAGPINLDSSPGGIYVSTNSGVTWAAANAPSTNWFSVACSADGSKMFAVVNGGGIWTSQSTPAPQMNITPMNGNLKLSWIVPSANFVMQQSLDLQNWADMTNQPVMNLTNLQNEVILSPQANSVFYRLKTP